MSIETTQSESTTTQTTDEIEFLPNPERGCGFLDDGKAYLRSDVSPDGDLPAFVEFAEPIPFKEDSKRSYKQFPGIQFELSVTGANGLTRTIPEQEINEHLARLEADRPTGTTAGEMVSFHSHDLLMSVGKTHYETAEQFTREAKIHGVNKAISVTSGNAPPVVNPGRTRLFLIHPRAVEITVTESEEQEVEKMEEVDLPTGETKQVTYTDTEMVEVEKTRHVPGVFGYTYLTRVVYTEDADGNVPKYIQDYEATGSLDVVKAGDPITYTEQAGFDAEGNPVDDEQETLYPEYEAVDLEELYPVNGEIGTLPTDRLLPADPGRFPALEAPTIETMERADLAALADREMIEGNAPPEGEDALYGDENGALAVITMDNEMFKVMPSNNLSVDESGPLPIATSVTGPYRLTVEDMGDEMRLVETRKTR
ncbi:hypothetical protein [Halapricum desulfuricans]|uniref:Uncharacterized protein n=1 Tax=Halapricum desulfuricans TaxID=2841257 RepID=A0A897N7J0_9EURY|nr:hypothetical protein [Halapricum desulfuricans]QSG06356.1 hypothetical protein HSR121_2024 [Halapricum desulfuricans]